MFSKASVILSTGGHAWQWGSMHGRGPCVVGACMAGGIQGLNARQLVCVAWGWGMCGRGHACRGLGHAWQGMCMVGGMHGRGSCVAGGMHGRGTCMVGGIHGGMHGRGCVW